MWSAVFIPVGSSLFLGVFTKLRKVTINFVISLSVYLSGLPSVVCPCACLCAFPFAWNNLDPSGRIFMKFRIWFFEIFMKFCIWIFFSKFCREKHVSLKSDENNVCIWIFFRNYVEKNMFHWNLTRITGTLHADLCVCIIHRLTLFLIRNVSAKSSR